MSSGNYQKPNRTTWFDFNRSLIIEGFNKLRKVIKRNQSIENLRNKIEQLEKQDSEEWAIYRDKCIEEEKIL